MSLNDSRVLQNRLILLGASNLTLSLHLVIHLMQQQLGGPGEIFAAVGHGRAYGVSSQMLFRGLPGIADCGMWRQLDVLTANPVYALLTDIGNDVMYELPPELILRSIERCIGRLQQQPAQIAVTNLPLASIECLSERRYRFFRDLFYPSCRLSRNEAVSRARMVHAGLIELAARFSFKLYEQNPAWFGPDGIHVNYWQRTAYYRDIVRQFTMSGKALENPGNQRKFLLAWQRRPTFAFKTILGRAINCPQPSGLLANDSRVYKY